MMKTKKTRRILAIALLLIMVCSPTFGSLADFEALAFESNEATFFGEPGQSSAPTVTPSPSGEATPPPIINAEATPTPAPAPAAEITAEPTRTAPAVTMAPSAEPAAQTTEPTTVPQSETIPESNEPAVAGTVTQAHNSLARVAADGNKEEMIMSLPSDEEDEIPDIVGSFCDVTFEYEDGTLIESEKVDKGTYASIPENPAPLKDGERFVFWYLATDQLQAAQPFDFLSTPINESITLRAKFTQDQYTVKFLNLYGNPIKVLVKNANDTVATEEAPSIDQLHLDQGQVFICWYDAADPEKTAFGFGQEEITEDIVLVASYSEQRAVTFVSDGTQVPGALVDEYNMVPVPVYDVDGNDIKTDPKKSMIRLGYTFQYWSADEKPVLDEEGKVVKAQEPFDFSKEYLSAEPLKLYAVWEVDEVDYTIEYWIEKPGLPYAEYRPETTPDKYQYHLTIKSPLKAKTGEVIQIDAAKAKLAEDAIDNATVKYDIYTEQQYIKKLFDFAGAEQNIVAKGDGSSIIRVYYNRHEFDVTFIFNTAGSAMGTQYANALYYKLPTSNKELAPNVYKTKFKLDEAVYDKFPSEVGVGETTPARPFSLWSGYYSLTQNSDVAFTINMYKVLSGGDKDYFNNATGRGSPFVLQASYAFQSYYFFRFYYLEMSDEQAASVSDSDYSTAVYTTVLANGLKSVGNAVQPHSYEGQQFNVPQYFKYTDHTGKVRKYELHIEYTTSYQQNNTSCGGWPGRVIPGYEQPNSNRDSKNVTWGSNGGIKTLAGVQPMMTAIKQTCHAAYYFCNLKTYSLTLNGMGGTVKKNGEKVNNVISFPAFTKTLPADLDQYESDLLFTEFDGWYFDGAYTIQATPSKVLEKTQQNTNLILYAKLKDIGVTVRYYEKAKDAENQVLKATVKTGQGKTITVPQDVIEYTEDNGIIWIYYLNDKPVIFKSDMPISKDIDLYPSHGFDKLAVTYFDVEDQKLKTYYVYADDSINGSGQIAPKDPPIQLDEYFLGWYEHDADGNAIISSRFSGVTKVTHDTVLYPEIAKPLTVEAKELVYDTSVSGAEANGWHQWSAISEADVLSYAKAEEALDVELGHKNLVKERARDAEVDAKEAYPPTARTLEEAKGLVSAPKAKMLLKAPANLSANDSGYDVPVEVRDSLNRDAGDTLRLYVLDTENPVITGDDAMLYWARAAEPLSVEKIRDAVGLALSDNYANSAWLESNLSSDFAAVFMGDKLKTPGTYTVTFATKDTVGNVGKKAVAVTIWDEEITATPITITASRAAQMKAVGWEAFQALMAPQVTYYAVDDYKTGVPGVVESGDHSKVLAAVSGEPYPMTFTSGRGVSGDFPVTVIDDYTVTATVTNGTIDKTTPTETNAKGETAGYQYGSTVNVTYAPLPGYELDSIAIDGEVGDLVRDANGCSFTMTENHTVNVVYKPIEYTVTVHHYVKPADVDPDAEADPDAPVAEPAKVADDTVLTRKTGETYRVTPMPDLHHYQPVDPDQVVEGTITVEVDGDGNWISGNVEAEIYYVRKTYEISVEVVNGTMDYKWTSWPEGATPTSGEADNDTIYPLTYAVESGDAFLVNYEPKPGYELSMVVIDGSSPYLAPNAVAQHCDMSYTFADIGADHSIKVVYTPIYVPTPTQSAEPTETPDTTETPEPTEPTATVDPVITTQPAPSTTPAPSSAPAPTATPAPAATPAPNNGTTVATATPAPTTVEPTATSAVNGATSGQPTVVKVGTNAQFSIFDDDIPLAGAASRTMGDKEE